MTGEPSWFEIGVADVARARSFWGGLLGWQFHDMPGANAWIETPTGRGGLHGADPSATLTLYLAVPDIDAAVQRVRELGGTADEPSAEQGDFGRFASCVDDQGVSFGLHQPPAQ
jgi:predicted enzyme related to lactoylglutathione lyase